MRSALVFLLVALVGCPRPARPTAPPVTDAPYDIADETDFELIRDRMWAMPPGAARDDTRAKLLSIFLDRARAHLDAHKHDMAHADLLAGASLYTADPDAIGAALAPHAKALAQIEVEMAKSGGDRETATALVLLASADPARAESAKEQLDEILAFVDDLAASEHGEVARGGAPIATIQPIVRALPQKWLVDRYVQMVLARQAKVAALLNQPNGATFDLVAAHRDVGVTARAIATVLARAGRAPEIAPMLEHVKGIGEDPDLLSRARHVAAGGGSDDWVALARDLRDSKGVPDPEAALAICLAARAKFGGDATATAAAAGHAAALGRVEQAIALYEAARAIDAADPELARKLAPLYRERLARLAESGRPNAARDQLQTIERFLDGAPGDWRGERALARVTAGKGLLGQGDVEAARTLLASSIELAPSAEAFDQLATIAIAREKWDEAREWTETGLKLPEREPEAQFAHAKLLRLHGDALAGQGHAREARNEYLEALREWADLGDKVELPPAAAGERMLESGKVLWALGEHDRAIDLIDAAMDVDDDGANTYLGVVAFLLGEGVIDHAADAVHRALGADGVTDFNKIYVCLQLVAESKGAGRPPDPLALEFLRTRNGGLWPDDLARFATGRADLVTVEQRATTRARKAELAYYSAMLGGLDAAAKRQAFARVIASDLVTYFEYDMAKLHAHQ
ncbi:MAG TPA: tetratricopeptide repeat protein [Kofleriaceae bacterium]|nr:tetratricopeptide repeat protein [Kofleriaceae bacterium]